MHMQAKILRAYTADHSVMMFSFSNRNKFFWAAVALLCTTLPLVAEQSKLIDELIFAKSSQISKNKPI
jgi:hypothetical protein